MERTMRDIVSDILRWPWLFEPHGYNFNGHLVHDPGGNVCIGVPSVSWTFVALLWTCHGLGGLIAYFAPTADARQCSTG